MQDEIDSFIMILNDLMDAVQSEKINFSFIRNLLNGLINILDTMERSK